MSLEINKVLIIGIGSIAKKHIAALRTINEDVRIYGLRSSTKSTKLEGITDIYNLDELDFAPDFVIISNPTYSHYQTIEECIKLQCPLFIEKPILSRLENGEALIQKIEKENIFTYVACNLRFHPVLQSLKNRLESESLRVEEVNVYCGSYLPDWRKGIDYKENYSAIASKGGGVHLDLIHEIDYCYWLFGSPIEVKKILTSNSHIDVDSVDYANYALIYDSFVVNIVLNYFRKSPKRTIEIVTEEKIILGDILENKVHISTLHTHEKFKINNTYADQLNYFIKHINGSKGIMNTAKEAFEVLKIVLA